MLLTNVNPAPVGQVNVVDLKKMAWNVLVFTAPALAVFFGQLGLGVDWHKALWVAALALYGIAADFFKKLNG